MFTVNVALSDHGEGGGTYFENLINNPFGISPIRKVKSPGHAIIHRSMERHAGALKTSGIREILVFFITTRQSKINPRAPGIERSFYLKSFVCKYLERRVLQKPIPQHLVIDCLFKAVQETPKDGEGYFWLGFQMFQNKYGESWDAVQIGIKCLEMSTALCPCDASFHYYLGIAYLKRWNLAERKGMKQNEYLIEAEEKEKCISSLERALELESEYCLAGCSDSFVDKVMVYFTLGQIYFSMKRHDIALSFLEKVTADTNTKDDIKYEEVYLEARHLMERCAKLYQK